MTVFKNEGICFAVVFLASTWCPMIALLDLLNICVIDNNFYKLYEKVTLLKE
jgi:hypothetical protein